MKGLLPWYQGYGPLWLTQCPRNPQVLVNLGLLRANAVLWCSPRSLTTEPLFPAQFDHLFQIPVFMLLYWNRAIQRLLLLLCDFMQVPQEKAGIPATLNLVPKRIKPDVIDMVVILCVYPHPESVSQEVLGSA